MDERRENAAMNWIGKNAWLMLAVALTLFLALARRQGGSAPVPAAPPAPVVEAPRPAAPVVKTRKRARKKVVAKLAEPPVEPVKVRGARLKDKGEALGGGTPDRVDTGTMTVRDAR